MLCFIRAVPSSRPPGSMPAVAENAFYVSYAPDPAENMKRLATVGDEIAIQQSRVKDTLVALAPSRGLLCGAWVGNTGSRHRPHFR